MQDEAEPIEEILERLGNESLSSHLRWRDLGNGFYQAPTLMAGFPKNIPQFFRLIKPLIGNSNGTSIQLGRDVRLTCNFNEIFITFLNSQESPDRYIDLVDKIQYSNYPIKILFVHPAFEVIAIRNTNAPTKVLFEFSEMNSHISNFLNQINSGLSRFTFIVRDRNGEMRCPRLDKYYTSGTYDNREVHIENGIIAFKYQIKDPEYYLDRMQEVKRIDLPIGRYVMNKKFWQVVKERPELKTGVSVPEPYNTELTLCSSNVDVLTTPNVSHYEGIVSHPTDKIESGILWVDCGEYPHIRSIPNLQTLSRVKPICYDLNTNHMVELKGIGVWFKNKIDNMVAYIYREKLEGLPLMWHFNQEFTEITPQSDVEPFMRIPRALLGGVENPIIKRDHVAIIMPRDEDPEIISGKISYLLLLLRTLEHSNVIVIIEKDFPQNSEDMKQIIWGYKNRLIRYEGDPYVEYNLRISYIHAIILDGKLAERDRPSLSKDLLRSGGRYSIKFS